MEDRPPSDSSPDLAPDVESAAPKSVRPRAPERPVFPAKIDTIIGSHLPGLVEEEVLKQQAAGAPASAASSAQPEKEHEIPSLKPPAIGDDPAWKSPLDSRPAWLIALMSIPKNIWMPAVGGLVGGLIVVTSVRGCVGKSRIDALETRVDALEKIAGIAADGGVAVTTPADGAASSAASGGTRPSSSAVAAADDPKKAKCAVAKMTAYQSWQAALDKAKTNAAPAEAKCSSFWTESKKQACMGAATAGIHGVQVARDSVMKGGAAARDAVKKVKDDPKNDALATAKAASDAAFDACGDENEL